MLNSADRLSLKAPKSGGTDKRPPYRRPASPAPRLRRAGRLLRRDDLAQPAVSAHSAVHVRIEPRAREDVDEVSSISANKRGREVSSEHPPEAHSPVSCRARCTPSSRQCRSPWHTSPVRAGRSSISCGRRTARDNPGRPSAGSPSRARSRSYA